MPTPLTYFSNRASSLFDKAIGPLGGRQFREGDSRIDLLYFCTYGGKQKPAVEAIHYDLVERQYTIPLDNKSRMARSLQLAGLDRPKTYFHPHDLPESPETLWYVKNPLATAGKDLFCVYAEEVPSVFKDGYIIQEAVTDLHLIDSRKYTLRVYALYFDQKIYIFNEGIAVVHGCEYVEGDLSPQVQFLHSGYERPESTVRLEAFREHPDSPRIFERLEESVASVFEVFMPTLSKGAANSYCVFGVDFLVTSTHDVVLIEINDRPNMLHTHEINNKVNIPMLQSLLAVMEPALQPMIHRKDLAFRKLPG